MSRVVFDESGGRRIVKGIKRIEAQPYTGNGRVPPMVSSGTPERWIRCTNDASEEIPAFSVVSITAGAMVGSRFQPKIKKPSTTFSREFGFTGTNKCASGGSLGVVQETALVKYDTGTPAYGEGWGIKPGQYTLSKGYPGAVCLGVWDSTAKIMLVRYLPFTVLMGKLDGTLNAASTATLSVWAGPAGSEVDTGWNITVRDWLMKSGSNIATGKKVLAQWIGDAWYATQGECA